MAAMQRHTGKPDERRQFGRLPVRYHGWIQVSGAPRIGCIVHNLSIGGALLELQEGHPAPGVFTLTIGAINFTAACETRHVESNSIGVEFLAPGKPASSSAAAGSTSPAPSHTPVYPDRPHGN
jgi:hypothetical protein